MLDSEASGSQTKFFYNTLMQTMMPKMIAFLIQSGISFWYGIVRIRYQIRRQNSEIQNDIP